MNECEVIEKHLQKVVKPLAGKLSEAVNILIPVQMSRDEIAKGIDELLNNLMPTVVEKIEKTDVREIIKSMRDKVMEEKKNGK